MTEKRKRRPKRQPKQFIVRKGAFACRYQHAGCFGLKMGVLVPCPHDKAPHIFTGPKSADKAISRTLRVRERLRGSMLDGWDKFASLLDPTPYVVEFVKPSG